MGFQDTSVYIHFCTKISCCVTSFQDTAALFCTKPLPDTYQRVSGEVAVSSFVIRSATCLVKASPPGERRQTAIAGAEASSRAELCASMEFSGKVSKVPDFAC